MAVTVLLVDDVPDLRARSGSASGSGAGSGSWPTWAMARRAQILIDTGGGA